MKLLFENWRAFQLKEIFDSPVDEVEKTEETENIVRWRFLVDDRLYEMMISRYNNIDEFKEWEVEFAHITRTPEKGLFRGTHRSWEPTNYGLETGTKVMSTVLKILEDWIGENKDNFFILVSSSSELNRTRLYNRLLKVIAKKLGDDYSILDKEPHNMGDRTIGTQILVNIGLIERRVDNFIDQSDWRRARNTISGALIGLEGGGAEQGEASRKIIAIFDKIQDAQFGPKGE
jgi:hypothetical protein